MTDTPSALPPALDGLAAVFADMALHLVAQSTLGALLRNQPDKARATLQRRTDDQLSAIAQAAGELQALTTDLFAHRTAQVVGGGS